MFKGWEGHCEGTELTTSVFVEDRLMTPIDDPVAHMVCFAFFEKAPYRLMVSSNTTGHTVAISPAGEASQFFGTCQLSNINTCREFKPTPLTVTLTAIPKVGYRFNRWGGYCDGTNPTTSLYIDDNLAALSSYIKCNMYFEPIH